MWYEIWWKCLYDTISRNIQKECEENEDVNNITEVETRVDEQLQQTPLQIFCGRRVRRAMEFDNEKEMSMDEDEEENLDDEEFKTKWNLVK